jgi:hypothetical protein
MDQRCFAGPVGANQRMDIALPNRHCRVVQRINAAEMLAQAANVQQGMR